MPVSMSDGVSPLRSSPTVKAGSANGGDNGSGPDCGGTEAKRMPPTIKQGATNSTPSGSVSRPAGVRTFADRSV